MCKKCVYAQYDRKETVKSLALSSVVIKFEQKEPETLVPYYSESKAIGSGWQQRGLDRKHSDVFVQFLFEDIFNRKECSGA